MKIIILDSRTLTDGDISFDEFSKYGEVVIYSLTPDELVAERIKDADVILCNKAPMNEINLSKAPNVKYIGLFATGYNNIDLQYTNAHNITVCNAGSYSTNAVAQHTFALILNKYNKVNTYNKFVSDDGWVNSDIFSPFVYPTYEVAGKTIGIIGYGSIGQAVARIANAFGMKVLVSTRTPKEDETVSFTDFDTLLANADIVSVHCPLNDASYHMFNKEAFSKCKKTAYFVNTSRGPIVDEQELREALDEGLIAGAAIDVLEKEPMREKCPLKDAKNIVITPHVAWAAYETRKRLFDIVEDNLKSYIEGNPKNVVK